MSKQSAYIIFLVSLLFFGCFFLWPIWQILKGGFIDGNEFTIAYFIQVFSDPLYLEGLLNSFAMGIFSTLGAALIAIPMAVMADRYNFPGRGLLMATILIPIMLPPFVGALGVKHILGEYGALNSLLQSLGLMTETSTIDWLARGRFWGIVAMNALSLYPILYLNALAALGNIDPAMDEAAENLGCRGWRKFFRITLPLMRPGLFAGGTIVFIWAFTELGVPLIFDYNRLTSVQIFNGIKDIDGNPFPYALVSVMLFFSVLFYLTGKFLFGRNNFAMLAKANHAAIRKTPGLPLQLFCTSFFVLVFALAVLPHLGVIFLSFAPDWYGTILPAEFTLRNYELALGHDLTVTSIRNSLFYASAASVLNVILGVLIAYVVVRTQVKGRFFLDALAMMPLAVPGLVIAFGYLAMTRTGMFFDFLDPVENPIVLLIIAYAVRKLPLVVRSAAAGFEQTSVTYEEAARNLGCSPMKAIAIITIPLIVANLLAGALLAFSQSMLEVSDSLILAQKSQYYPITKAIFELLQLLGDGPYIASALGVWAMAFLGVTILATNMLLGKKLGAIFRV